MTLEHRIVVELGDIRTVIFECRKCLARVSLSPEKMTAEKLNRCPFCPNIWLEAMTTTGQKFTSDMLMFLSLFALARKSQQEGDSKVGVRVLLELDAPPLSGSSSTSSS